MKNDFAISLKDITFAYDDRLIFDKYCLEINSGSFVCLTGESGCGKSTLLEIISGFLSPQNGQVIINNKILKDKHLVEIRKDMGYVLQDGSLFPHFSVYQNMTYCLKLQNISEEFCKSRINELLPFVGLDNSLLDKFPCELSGGQRQRVGIIRGIAHKPSIVLMDEPFSALDPETRRDLQDLVKDIHKNTNTTFVMVTHSISEAQKLGTNIVKM